MYPMSPSVLSAILLFSTVGSVFCWTSAAQTRKWQQKLSSSRSSKASSESDVMLGASTFEKWFASIPGANFDQTISHADFGNLRGLAVEKVTSDLEATVMKIPKAIVLNSEFEKADWDIELAQKLWTECVKGPSSSVSGYVSLLTGDWSLSDLPHLPPKTAPDALRHWTDEQKSILSEDTSGQRLLDLLEKQNNLWQEKFSRAKGVTMEEFQWAMEVVHSRAFCGDFGVGGSKIPPTLAAAVPIATAFGGFLYQYQNPDPSDAVLLGLGLVAAIPTMLNVISPSPPVAVLLPMIDSINHLENADSTIDYSPLSESFSLSVGSNCFVEEGGKTQLYVSYGKKKDSELLLNYGFLPGVSLDGDADSRRRALSEAFISRKRS